MGKCGWGIDTQRYGRCRGRPPPVLRRRRYHCCFARGRLRRLRQPRQRRPRHALPRFFARTYDASTMPDRGLTKRTSRVVTAMPGVVCRYCHRLIAVRFDYDARRRRVACARHLVTIDAARCCSLLALLPEERLMIEILPQRVAATLFEILRHPPIHGRFCYLASTNRSGRFAGPPVFFLMIGATAPAASILSHEPYRYRATPPSGHAYACICPPAKVCPAFVVATIRIAVRRSSLLHELRAPLCSPRPPPASFAQHTRAGAQESSVCA